MSVCAILLSYKRPQNMEKLLQIISTVPEIDKIILSNNNPDVDIFSWIDASRSNLTVINQKVHTLYTKRFEIAHNENHEYFFCPDDDIFLDKKQISYLIKKLKDQPEKAHGMYGQVQIFENGKRRMAGGVHGITCEVDVLNRAYFFTKKHMNRVMELAGLFGLSDINEAVYMEDGLLSFASEGRPICHAIGYLDDCPTSQVEGIATHKENEFDEIRLEGFYKLRTITGRR